MEIKEVSKQATKKEARAIIQSFDYRDLMVVYGELSVLDKALRNLWAITMSTQDDKLKSDNYKWLIEMGVGKARQSVDMTSKGERVTAGIFINNE
jgi:hypothetical protein